VPILIQNVLLNRNNIDLKELVIIKWSSLYKREHKVLIVTADTIVNKSNWLLI